MKNFKSVDKWVDFTHETLHKDDFTEANAHVAQFGRKSLQLVEIVQLHSSAKIEQHVGEIRAFGTEFLQYSGCNQFDGKFNVAKRRSKSNAVGKRSVNQLLNEL